MLLEVSAILPLGVNVFAYVVENGRYGALDAKIAQTVTKYLFNGQEAKPNLVIVMTKCTRQQLQLSQQEKAEWLEEQSRKNEHFMSLYEMVNQDPSRFFMVDNEEGMRRKNEKGIKPLQRYVLDIDTTLQWLDADLLERASELNEEIEYLKLHTPEAMEQELQSKEEEIEELQKEMGSRVKARSKDFGCFGGLCEVLVRGRGVVKMRDLAIGDLVATGQGLLNSRKTGQSIDMSASRELGRHHTIYDESL